MDKLPPRGESSLSANAEVYELPLTAGRLNKIFWAYTWRAGFLGVLVFGFFAFFVTKFIPKIGVVPELAALVSGFFAFITVAIIAQSAFKRAFKKDYREFRIALIPYRKSGDEKVLDIEF